MSDQTKAYMLAKSAAEIDFDSALQGLMAGHKEAIEKVKNERAQIDMAFLAALSLTNKGSRLDRDGVLAQKIVDGISKVNMCGVEKKFVDENSQ